MQFISRYGTSAVVATTVTFALFFLMQMLIESGKSALDEDSVRRVIDMVRVEREEQVQRKERVERPPENEKPPELETPQSTSLSASGQNVSFNFNVGAGNVDSGLIGVGDGEYLPIVKVQPQYPRRALERSMEGTALVEFTVNPDGTVSNPVVLEENPPGYGFGRAAAKAALKFKYQPRVVNGEAVPVTGVRNLFTFELADE